MDSSPFGRRLRSGDMVLPEGIEVGFVGGLTVVAVAAMLAWRHPDAVEPHPESH